MSNIFIYQMGKVGSTTLEESLKKIDYNVVHIHTTNPFRKLSNWKSDKIKFDKAFVKELYQFIRYNNIYVKNKKRKIISVVREPIGRNISAYFQNINKFNYNESKSNDELIDIFKNVFNDRIQEQWYSRELEPYTGINIYDYVFDSDKGYSIIKKNNCELLLIKVEMLNDVVEVALKEFLGVTNFELINANMSSDKKYNAIYSDFKKNINFSNEYIDSIYSSEFVNYFYNDSEIKLFKEKWRCSGDERRA